MPPRGTWHRAWSRQPSASLVTAGVELAADRIASDSYTGPGHRDVTLALIAQNRRCQHLIAVNNAALAGGVEKCSDAATRVTSALLAVRALLRQRRPRIVGAG